MPLFEYRAHNAAGDVFQDYLLAKNEAEAEEILNARGLEAVYVRRAREVGTPKSHPINARNLSLLFRQLASLRRAGVPLSEALNIAANQFSPPLGDLVAQVQQDVNSGSMSFPEALGRHPQIPRHIVGIIRAADESGRVREAMEDLADALAKGAYFRGLAVSAMTYPAIMFSLAVVLSLAMVYFLVPSMLGSLESIAGPGFVLPLPTRILLGISDFLRNPLGLLLLLGGTGGGVYLLLRTWRSTGEGRLAIERFILRMPLLGELFAKSQMITAARMLSSMSESNLPLPRALGLLEGTLSSLLYQRAIREVREMVEGGVSLAVAFRRHPHLFSALFRSMVEIGERNADLSNMLREVSRIYEEEYELRLKGLSSALEPVMLVMVGGVIGSIMLAVLLPYFSTLSNLGG